MIIGILLGISLSVLLASLTIIIGGYAGVFRENLLTGAVIGNPSIISYSIITLFLSLLFTIILIVILKNKYNKAMHNYKLNFSN
jgi:hypothetical protein